MRKQDDNLRDLLNKESNRGPQEVTILTPGRVYKNAVTTSTCLEGHPKKDILGLT